MHTTLGTSGVGIYRGYPGSTAVARGCSEMGGVALAYGAIYVVPDLSWVQALSVRNGLSTVDACKVHPALSPHRRR